MTGFWSRSRAAHRALKGRGRIGRTADTEIGVLVTDAMTSAELLDLVDELQSTSKLPIMLGQGDSRS